MKKFEKSSLPSIFGSQSRPVSEVKDITSLKNSGVPFANYGLSLNDEIAFPNTIDDVQVFTQPIRANQPNSPVQTLLVVERNGKPGYLSLGSLHRRGVNVGDYTCKFTKEMDEMNSDYDRVIALLGKKIKCTSMSPLKVQAFDRLSGERLEGQTREVPAPVIEYV